MLDSMYVIGLALARPNALLVRQLGVTFSWARAPDTPGQVVG